MGVTQSTLTPAEVHAFEKSTGFNSAQVHRLYRRFQRLDRAGTGAISSEDFMSIPELAMNPLVERIIEIFDRNTPEGDNLVGGVEIHFDQFLKTLAVFLPMNERHRAAGMTNEEYEQAMDRHRRDKLRFVFQIYDVHDDGFVDQEELFQVLKMMVTDGISDEQLSFIVEQTIQEADGNGDGKISFDEFCQILQNTDVDNRMTIRF